MSKSFLKLLISQLFANLADIFLRVSLIANIYVITKSVIATSMVPILIDCQLRGKPSGAISN